VVRGWGRWGEVSKFRSLIKEMGWRRGREVEWLGLKDLDFKSDGVNLSDNGEENCVFAVNLIHLVDKEFKDDLF